MSLCFDSMAPGTEHVKGANPSKSSQWSWGWYSYPILKMRDQRLRELKWPIYCHMVCEQQTGFKSRSVSCWSQSSWAQGSTAVFNLEAWAFLFFRCHYVEGVVINEKGRWEQVSMIEEEKAIQEHRPWPNGGPEVLKAWGRFSLASQPLGFCLCLHSLVGLEGEGF